MEKLILKYPTFYRFLAGFRKKTNADKLVFSHYIKRGDTVVDCGANIGYYTNFFRAIVGKQGSVHAFEPVPSTFEYLTKNILEYSKCKNYRLNMAGLYKTETTKNIYIPDSISGHASLNKHNDAWNAQYIEEKEIKLVPLDIYIENNGINKIDFIKIDVEGSEIDTLYGARLSLQRSKPTLHIEVNSELFKNSKHSVKELWEFLKELGYKTIYYYDADPNLLLDFEKLIVKEKVINTNIIAVN